MYNLDIILTDDNIRLRNEFIPKAELKVRVLTNTENIQNIKMLVNNREIYMTKSKGKYESPLYRNYATTGENTFAFIVETPSKDVSTNEIHITLDKVNIVQYDFDQIPFLLTELNKILKNIE